MKINTYLSLALVSSLTLVGCDKCSEKKDQPSTSQSVTPSSETDATSAAAPGSSPSLGEQPADMGTAPAEPTTAQTSPDTSGGSPSMTPQGSETPASSSTDTAVSTGSTSPSASSAASTAAPKGELKITDVKVGKGPEAVDGKKVTVHYTGTLENGTKFDSSKDRGTPFPFILGSGMVISGWEKGVLGMKEGGVRKLVIPSHLAYGERSVGGVIPPNSTLLFEIELLKVE